ncbi:hypothetical protein [Rhizobium grahamii]|uniref:hypothetical protein n=1 Tax=Rhizobium grahamii TaxID=1120045 RepID=UPI0002DCAAEB|nr:hypothetical protein [Rhizobium grahamii]
MQRAPELILAIKESVDREDEPGRFLLNGSANLATVPAIADSLAGRMAVHCCHLPNLRFNPLRVVCWIGFFAGEEPSAWQNTVVGDELRLTVLQGGYPEALRRPTPRRRTAWLEDYVNLILDRDVVISPTSISWTGFRGCSMS